MSAHLKPTTSVTITLSGIGVVVGGTCGATLAVVLPALHWGTAGLLLIALRTVPTAVTIGALTGMIAAPLLGWGLLRRVPLGRVITRTAFGTFFGAEVSELVRLLFGGGISTIVAGGLLGALAVSVALHRYPGDR